MLIIFNGHQDGDAIAYLTLANKLIHEVNKNAITIAEEVSGMPGLAAKYEDGGYGFDYRMAMNIPRLLDQDDQGKERRRLASFFHPVGRRRTAVLTKRQSAMRKVMTRRWWVTRRSFSVLSMPTCIGICRKMITILWWNGV